jgi:hypothetical protein
MVIAFALGTLWGLDKGEQYGRDIAMMENYSTRYTDGRESMLLELKDEAELVCNKQHPPRYPGDCHYELASDSFDY